MKKISIAICTWNRCDLLRQTLEGFRSLHSPQGLDWEVVVVDNNSTDTTAQVVESFAGHLPIRRVFEPKQGLSNARNTAIDSCIYRWILFTDDDVLVDKNWLLAYCNAIESSSEDIAFLGGPIDPWFPEPPDPDVVATIPGAARGFCGVAVKEDKTIFSEKDGLPVGANFMVSKDHIGDLRFDPCLGLNGAQRFNSDETQFLKALLSRGCRGRWVPNARVRHYVIPERLTVASLRRHYFDIGRTVVRVDGLPPGKTLFGVPAWLLLRATRQRIRMGYAYALGRRRSYLALLPGSYIASGMIYESFLSRRSQSG